MLLSIEGMIEAEARFDRRDAREAKCEEVEENET